MQEADITALMGDVLTASTPDPSSVLIKPEPHAPPTLLAMASMESTTTAIQPLPKSPTKTRRRKTASKRPARPAVAPLRSSVMRGVTRHTRTGRFDAHIWCDGRQWYLGAFTSELLAGMAFDVASIKMRPNELPLNLSVERYQGRLGQLLDTVCTCACTCSSSTVWPQMSIEAVLEATRYASKKRDVYDRPDAAAFCSDPQAMLALLLQAFEVVAATHHGVAQEGGKEAVQTEHMHEPWQVDDFRTVQDLLESAQQQPKRPRSEGLWVATGPSRDASEGPVADGVLFPTLLTPTVGLTPTFGAFSPMGGMTPTALLAEGSLWAVPDCWGPVEPRLPGVAQADDDMVLLYQGQQVPGWD